MAAENVSYIFDNTVTPRDITKFTLMRGVTDFTNLSQYDLYETGYSFLISLQIPTFLDKLASTNENYKNLIDNYRHIMEYDFRGAQGIEDITSDTNPLTNGIDELNIITRVREQGGTNFSFNYFERSGSTITKTHEIFLRGIKDPRTQVKRYNGLLRSRFKDAATTTGNNLMTEKGYQYEIFHYLLIITDNTALNVEKAYILASVQPAAANTGTIYNVTRGEISFQELQISMNGFPIPGRIVNEKACKFLDWINETTCFDEMQFGYQILGNENIAPGRTGAITAVSPTVDDFGSKTI
jgi:hypothetical protein|nr:MAG TPA: hypothetical protein [Caudoviricetes sp.]DAT64696.1 MAG TPA: hypothetical protein [Caudoviricetes sp.]